MVLTQDERMQVQGFLLGKGVRLDELADAVGLHRTSVHKKLYGATGISACELLEMGAAIERHKQSRRTGGNG